MTRLDSLKPLEAAFVQFESERAPLHMASICLFEGDHLRDDRGRIRLHDLRQLIERRLHLVPALRRRLQPAFLGGAPPTWVDDEQFDIARHIVEAKLRHPGGERELLARCAQLLAHPLDRRHPLWRIWVFDGLADGRVPMLVALHHAMADGLAGVAVATVLFDMAPDAEPPGPPPPWHPVAPPSGPLAALEDLARLAVLPARAGLSLLWAARHPTTALHRAEEVADAMGSVFNPRLVAPRSSLNRPIGKGRQLAVVRQPIDQVRRVSARFGTTVNDVLLAAVGVGLGDLLASRGERVADHELQVIVPVALSRHEDKSTGNAVSALFVRVPLGPVDPVERLRRVAAAVAYDKSHHQKLVATVVLGLLAPFPQQLMAAIAAVIDHQPITNLIVTDVPGPPVPFYVLGDRLAEVIPVVPIVGNLTVGVAALSYDKQLALGLLADPSACPDLEVLAEGVRRGFAELVEAADATGGRRAGEELPVG